MEEENDSAIAGTSLEVRDLEDIGAREVQGSQLRQHVGHERSGGHGDVGEGRVLDYLENRVGVRQHYDVRSSVHLRRRRRMSHRSELCWS